MFLRFTVRCAAYAAWTTPGLVKTDKTCVKLTCLYQVRVFPQKYTQVVGKCFVQRQNSACAHIGGHFWDIFVRSGDGIPIQSENSACAHYGITRVYSGCRF